MSPSVHNHTYFSYQRDPFGNEGQLDHPTVLCGCGFQPFLATSSCFTSRNFTMSSHGTNVIAQVQLRNLNFKRLIEDLSICLLIKTRIEFHIFSEEHTRYLDPVYTSTDLNGSAPKLAQIGLPFTLDLWICTHLGLLSGSIWNRFPMCTHSDPYRLGLV